MAEFSSLEIALIVVALAIVVAIFFAAMNTNSVDSDNPEKDDSDRATRDLSKASLKNRISRLEAQDDSSPAEKVSISHTHPITSSKVIDLSDKKVKERRLSESNSISEEPAEFVVEIEPDIETTKEQTKGYRYWSFKPIQLRGEGGEDALQISSLHLFRNGEWIEAQDVSNPGGSNPESEGPENANNDNITTKWLDLNKGPLVYDLGSEELITSYNWATANDDPERDPIAWILEASNNGEDWVVVDDKSSHLQDITVDRQVWVGSDGMRHEGFKVTLKDK